VPVRRATDKARGVPPVRAVEADRDRLPLLPLAVRSAQAAHSAGAIHVDSVAAQTQPCSCCSSAIRMSPLQDNNNFCGQVRAPPKGYPPPLRWQSSSEGHAQTHASRMTLSAPVVAPN
jgi:hypothetical protein